MTKVCVFTGSRAEFGLLRPLLHKLKNSKKFKLQIVAMAMHLSPSFGNTYQEIEQSGFKIDVRIPTLLSGDDANSINKSIGLAQIGIADALSQLQPELAIILGDRTEMIAAATCCNVANIPIAHLHGGEITEGAYDDAIRHAISKMSYYHFASTEDYRNRLIQLGENPERVFNVGAIGIDSIKELNLLSREKLEKAISLKLKSRSILVTYHPVTLEDHSARQQIDIILDALSNFLSNTSIIFTYANSDKDGKVINERIEKFVKDNSESCKAFRSLGQLRYLSALKNVSLVLGNSSSGILEAPVFQIPTVNIGDRQKGRVKPKSVIQVPCERKKIIDAIDLSFTKEMRNSIKAQNNLYGDGTTSTKIMEVLSSINSGSINLKKGFYDLNYTYGQL